MAVTSPLPDFYDALAPFYHLIYPDWEASIARQANALDSVIREFCSDARTVLDAACGIGTQSLGLASLGYHVNGSDFSPASVERAREEAQRRGLDIDLALGDMRRAWTERQTQFDVVIACDNAIAHLLSDDEIAVALREFYHCTAAGGICIVSLRDYDTVDKLGTQVKPYGIHQEDGHRYLLWQVWEFGPDDRYTQDLYLVDDAGGCNCQTRVMRSTSYAVSPDTVAQLMEEAGFESVQRLNDRFFQPCIVGMKRKP
jgi:SAM-dependent methyltransferase